MPIRAECGHCRKAFAAPDRFAGKTVACPSCRAPIAITDPDSGGLADLLDDVIPVAATHHEKYAVEQPAPRPRTTPVRSQATRANSQTAVKKLLAILGGIITAIAAFGGIIAFLVNGGFPGLFDNPVQRYQKITDEGVATFDSLLDVHMKIHTADEARAAAPGITDKWNQFLRIADEDQAFRKKKYRLRDIEKMKQISRDTEKRVSSTAERLGLRIGMLCVQGEAGRIVVQAIPDGVGKWAPPLAQLKAEVMRIPPSQPPPGPLANPSSGAPLSSLLTPSEPASLPAPASSEVTTPTVPSPPAPTPIVPQTEFQRKAEWALRRKHSGEAADYLRADILTKDDRAIVDQLRWCPGLKRPALNLFWGIGIEPIVLPASNHLPDSTPNFRDIPFDLRKFARSPRMRLYPFAQREMEKILGPMLDSLLKGLQERVSDGRFGIWQSVETKADSVRDLVGVMLTTVCPQAEQLEIARNQGMDVLLLARVERKVAVMKRGAGTARLTLRLFDVLSGKLIWESAPLSSTEAGADIQKADRFVETFFVKVDEILTLRDLPNVKSAAVPKRVAKIAESEPEAALCALAEIRYYVCKGLLETDLAIPHYQKLLGVDPGTGFASESVDERRKAVEHLLEAN